MSLSSSEERRYIYTCILSTSAFELILHIKINLSTENFDMANLEIIRFGREVHIITIKKTRELCVLDLIIFSYLLVQMRK